MSVRRTPVLIAVLVALVCGVLATGSAGAQASPAPRTTASAGLVRTAVVGQPPQSYAFPPGAYFAFPNRSTAERMAIRNRVLYTINSTWGGARNSLGQPMPGNGRIRLATWSFNDMTVAKALVAARNRGVSVQIVAASSANLEYKPWKYLLNHLGSLRYVPGHPETAESASFARQCRGSCRGAGGTPHSKFFLFDNVGSRHVRGITIQSSMNLTKFAYTSQWNQAQVVWSSTVQNHFRYVFNQMRVGQAVQNRYLTFRAGNVASTFYPLPGANATRDNVMQMLNRVHCLGAQAGGSSRTKVRIINYAIYGERGTWLAKKLRSLWNAGCDVAIIYSVSSRPVVSILRYKGGRGPIPMRQSVITNGDGEIVKYNHSKWMTIVGNYGSSRAAYVTMSGSANWSAASFGNDEQMQVVSGRPHAVRYLKNFTTTWRQKSSHSPGYGVLPAEGRVPPSEPTWGQGVYKYLSPNG